MSEKHVTHFKNSLSQYIGRIGEKLALEYLLENGFEVLSFDDCLTVALSISQREIDRSIKTREQVLREYALRIAERDLFSCLEDFLASLPEEYKVFPSAPKSRYTFISDKSGHSTLIYVWGQPDRYPVTPRKSLSLINKSRYKGMRIDNKILLAEKFSKKTKELAKTTTNLALVEANRLERQAKIEGEIADHILISLLLHAIQIPEQELQERRTQTATKWFETHIERLRASSRVEEIKEHEKTVKQHFGDRWNNFLRFCDVWQNNPEVPSGKKSVRYGEDFEDKSTDWAFDYAARKGSENYFVEVKTNKARLRKYQEKMMMKAKEFGFVPMIVRPKVSIAARMEEVTAEEL